MQHNTKLSAIRSHYKLSITIPNPLSLQASSLSGSHRTGFQWEILVFESCMEDAKAT